MGVQGAYKFTGGRIRNACLGYFSCIRTISNLSVVISSSYNV